MTSKDKWMKWRRELMDDCGQCVGFRAKGLELPAVGEGHVCKPNEACPKHCPGFQMDFEEIAQELAGDVVEAVVQQQKESVEIQQNNPSPSAVHCSKCGRSDQESYLIPMRHAGESIWICTKCLPGLIHG